MNRKKEILIAVIAIIMMIIIGQSYIIHNQARFDGDRKNCRWGESLCR